jgi:hypothetical protein
MGVWRHQPPSVIPEGPFHGKSCKGSDAIGGFRFTRKDFLRNKKMNVLSPDRKRPRICKNFRSLRLVYEIRQPWCLYGPKSDRASHHLHGSRICCGLHDSICRAGRYPGDTGLVAPDDSRDTGITRITGTSIIAPDYPFDNSTPRITGTGCRMHPC